MRPGATTSPWHGDVSSVRSLRGGRTRVSPRDQSTSTRSGVLLDQGNGRVEELLPVRYARMAADEFSFLRGAAAVMAADIALGPSTDLTVQLCGDAHLSNFGVFFSPERRLVFDINDFDETHPGPFEWDVKRLVASIAVAAESLNLSKGQQERAVFAAVQSYRNSMRLFSLAPTLDVWYAHLEIESALKLLEGSLSDEAQRRTQVLMDKARGKGSQQGVLEARGRDARGSGDQVRPTAARPDQGPRARRRDEHLRVPEERAQGVRGDRFPWTGATCSTSSPRSTRRARSSASARSARGASCCSCSAATAMTPSSCR